MDRWIAAHPSTRDDEYIADTFIESNFDPMAYKTQMSLKHIVKPLFDKKREIKCASVDIGAVT